MLRVCCLLDSIDSLSLYIRFSNAFILQFSVKISSLVLQHHLKFTTRKINHAEKQQWWNRTATAEKRTMSNKTENEKAWKIGKLNELEYFCILHAHRFTFCNGGYMRCWRKARKNNERMDAKICTDELSIPSCESRKKNKLRAQHTHLRMRKRENRLANWKRYGEKIRNIPHHQWRCTSSPMCTFLSISKIRKNANWYRNGFRSLQYTNIYSYCTFPCFGPREQSHQSSVSL